MVQASQRTALSGPALIRLLARLTDADIPESGQSLSDRLSQWLGWTDAIALSTALSGHPPAAAGGARIDVPAEADECARVRAALTRQIAVDCGFGPSRRRGAETLAVETDIDYPVLRQRYSSIQQSMETAIGNLRGRLRSVLAASAPGMTRLAMVDAVMEQALGARERTLLAAVPVMLGSHFERLRRAEAAALAEAQPVDAQAAETRAAAPGAWLIAFRKDMQSVLLAELELRIQPVEGLLAALRTR